MFLPFKHLRNNIKDTIYSQQFIYTHLVVTTEFSLNKISLSQGNCFAGFIAHVSKLHIQS